MASFIWFTIVIVGILVSSLAMISMGAACWDYCDTVPIIAQYLVISGSIFFGLLILLLLLTFCICTSSGDLKISGGLKVVLGISVTITYILILVGSTLLFLHSSEENSLCNNTSTQNEDLIGERFNTTAPRTADFCSSTLPIFSHSVLVIFHVLLFFSLLIMFYNNSK